MQRKKVVKKSVGRKPKITQYTLGKLREAFLLGCSDVEACFYAEIHPDTLYDYQKKNPEYTEQKKLLKSNPILLARRTVVDGLKTDATLALKYLERKLSSEFSLKQTVVTEEDSPRITGINYIVPKGSVVPAELYDRSGNSVSVIASDK